MPVTLAISLSYVFSFNAVNARIASFVIELWFRWHQSLWNHRPEFIKVYITF
jgi:hypothetical protein